MGVGIPARARVTAGVVATAALITSTSLVSAHGGDPTVVHACVVSSSGAIRIVAPDASCRPGEVSLDWSVGRGAALQPGSVTGEGDNDAATTPSGELALGTVGRANLVDGAVDGTKVAATFLASLVTELELTQVLGTLVTDSELSAILGTLVTDIELAAALDALLPLTAADIGDSAVTGMHLQNGTVTAADLAGSDSGTVVIGAVTSEKIADGTIAARDIADGAVTSSELAGDAVTGPKVANGSLSADDTAANAGYTVAGGTTDIPVGSSARLGAVPLTVAGGVHEVLVTGHAVVECTACTDPGDSATVQWTVADGAAAAVTHSGTVTLTSVDRIATLPVSFLVENAAAGAHAYQLELTVLAGGTDPVTATSASLVAVDLGRNPAP